MIPISDNIFIVTRKKPIIVYWLIGINIALFLWELKLEIEGILGNLVYNWGLIPAQMNGAIGDVLSGNLAAGIFLLSRSTSLLTAMFIHGSFSQILGNLLFLWVFGRNLEKILGHGQFIGFYLMCGILTEIIQILADPSLTIPLIGANGAIASILGAYVYKFPKVKIDTVMPLLIVFIPVQLPAVFYTFWWLVQQLFYGIGSLSIPGGVNPLTSINYWAQIAGLIIGATAMRQLKRR
ncbi:rhomboid family intramembrane serine protease [Fischerella sp. PCC 9605]|uniref:rhomboid family intramembrane serine protease n=1 Tax=Fischerella sp. PCC 9605 TaxID=1173024 RepID=UPI00047B99EB|nr:rhomboid family intramembrane serine protease [Fischerella sp. PCC 9605]